MTDLQTQPDPGEEAVQAVVRSLDTGERVSLPVSPEASNALRQLGGEELTAFGTPLMKLWAGRLGSRTWLVALGGSARG